jgi:broad specificity phosphatase PhoE
MPEVTLYLIRHGEADSNALGILSSYPEITGTTDRHLTERGRAMVQETAKSLKEEGIDAIIASPLTRTLETAALISEAIGVPVRQDIRLRETDFGQFNNLPMERFFEVYDNPEKRIQTTGEDGVESIEATRERVMSLLKDIMERFNGQKVALVSHSDTLEQIHGIITAEDIQTSALGWSPSTASVAKFIWTVNE